MEGSTTVILFYDKNEELIRVASSEVIQTLTSTETLTDEGYISKQLFGELGVIPEDVMQQVEYLALPVPGKKHQHDFYWLKDYQIAEDVLTIQGVDSGIEELRKTPVYDVRPRDTDLRPAVEQLLDQTNWTVGYVPDLPRRDTHAYYTDVFTALKRYASVWNVEFEFVVEITDTGIGDRYINFYKRAGKNRGARVVYGHNALEIIQEVDRAEMYTALVGRGKGEEVGETEDGDATYGRKINFEDVSWSMSTGDPVDKPRGQRYVEIPERTALYGVRRGNKLEPKIGFIEFNDEEDREALLEQTYEELERVSRPQVMMKASGTYLSAEVGDTVRVVRPDLDFDYETRAFEVVRDRIHEKTVSVTLGDRLIQSPAERERKIASGATLKAEENLRPVLEEVINKVVSADGRTTNYYGEIDPREAGVKPRVGDLWFRPDPDQEGEAILYVWDGEIWNEIIRTTDVEKVAREIEKQEEALAEHQRKIDEIRKRQDEELAEFEDHLAEIKENQLTHEELAEEIERLIGEYQLDDEAIDAAIERAGFSREEIDEIKKMAQEVNEKTEGVLEIVGEAGKPPEYSKNLSKTESVSLEYGESPKALELFKDLEDGQTYTLSYEAVCEPYETESTMLTVFGTLGDPALYTEEEAEHNHDLIPLDNSQKYTMTLTPVKELPAISTTDVNHGTIYWLAEPVVGEHILTIESPGHIKPFRQLVTIKPGEENLYVISVQLELQTLTIEAPEGTVCRLTNEHVQEEPFKQTGNAFHVPIFPVPYELETVEVPQFYEHYQAEVLVDRPNLVHKIELQRKPAEWVARIRSMPIPFPAEEVENSEMMPGEREVIQEGVSGMSRTTWEAEVIDGVETGERRNERIEIAREPVPEIIHIGTAKVEWRTETRREIIKRAVEEIQDPEMERGETRTVTGRDGYREYTFERKYINDQRTDEVRNEKLTDVMASVSDKVYIGTRVTEWREETRRENIPYQTVYRDDPNLEIGETRIEGGTDGYRVYSLERKYINGLQTSDIRNEKLMYTVEAKDAVVYTGTMIVEVVNGVRKVGSDTYEIDDVTLRSGQCSMPAVATRFVKLLGRKLLAINVDGNYYEVTRFDEATSSFWGYDFHLNTEPNLHMNQKVTAQFIFK